MKSLFIYPAIAAFILLTTLPSHAQTERGTKLIGGDGNIHISNDYFRIGIYPNIGLFINDNFALGASLPLYYSGQSESSSKEAGFTPFFRYYFGEGSTRLFASAALGYSRMWHHSYYDNRDHYSSSGYGTGTIGIGLVHFLTNQIGAEAKVTYGGFTQGEHYSGSVNLNLGFQIYLPSSK